MSALHLSGYLRYGRQMILDGFGLQGQLNLQDASVAVVGAGGLGCPALQYLAAAGVGTLGIFDHDQVELSNLSRQILHDEDSVGMPKALSAARSIKRINPNITVNAMVNAVEPANAISLLSPYDIILDCTDNAPTRYLLSDTAVHLGKPLISGAAQRYEGQLCVYNLPPSGPCYRCLFPRPPSPESMTTCAEAGILGVVTGIIGNLQALEAIKLITGLNDGKPTLLVFSTLGSSPFRSIKLRSRKPSCPACGQDGGGLRDIHLTDYIQFCGGVAPDWERLGLVVGNNPDNRIQAKVLKEVLGEDHDFTLIDVRPRTEFGICSLPNFINVPLNDLVADPLNYLPKEFSKPIYVVCRLGNDSQIAAAALREADPQRHSMVKDLIGGLRAWAREVDQNFPVY